MSCCVYICVYSLLKSATCHETLFSFIIVFPYSAGTIDSEDAEHLLTVTGRHRMTCFTAAILDGHWINATCLYKRPHRQDSIPPALRGPIRLKPCWEIHQSISYYKDSKERDLKAKTSVSPLPSLFFSN